jgi:hypothetical protein
MSVTTIPILPSPDFDETARFYAPLGFVEKRRWLLKYLLLRVPKALLVQAGSASMGQRCRLHIRFDTPAEARALHKRWKGSVLEVPALSACPD